MSAKRVPTIPQNYAVWYDYVTHSNDELCEDIERHMTRGDDFSPEVCRTIYERHYMEELHAEVEGIQGAVRRTVESVLGELTGLGKDIRHFSGVLSECGVTLSDEPTAEELQALIIRLARETQTARARSEEVESSFHSMAHELTELRAQVDRLSRDSRTDPLTGVANRRAFDQALARLVEDAQQKHQDLALIMADIDHFKSFNDRFGHLIGDKVLRFVAQEMEQCVKGRDLLARYGGEEFVVLLPNTPYDGARMLAESIRAIIEAQQIRDEGGALLDKVSISLGVAAYHPGEDPRAFVDRADACLYQSKQRGRNRVTGEQELD
jgi:diguanylate cyclase